METYVVTLYGNRPGALIKADYLVSETSDYKEARARVNTNGGWGSIISKSTKARAVACNDEFIAESLAQGLNIKRGFIDIKKDEVTA